jgi:hypothetical protein
MKALTHYALLADRHWRTWSPRRVAELEQTGCLRAKLQEAAERTARDSNELEHHFLQQGLTLSQARQRAWEIVMARYLFVPPED